MVNSKHCNKEKNCRGVQMTRQPNNLDYPTQTIKGWVGIVLFLGLVRSKIFLELGWVIYIYIYLSFFKACNRYHEYLLYLSIEVHEILVISILDKLKYFKLIKIKITNQKPNPTRF